MRTPPARPPCRDGGRLSSLRPRASAACQWRVIKKLSYQHQKEMKKLMRNVGLRCPLKKYEEMFDDDFKEKVRSASALSVRCIAGAAAVADGRGMFRQNDVKQEETDKLVARWPDVLREMAENEVEETEAFGQEVKYGDNIQVRAFFPRAPCPLPLRLTSPVAVSAAEAHQQREFPDAHEEHRSSARCACSARDVWAAGSAGG